MFKKPLKDLKKGIRKIFPKPYTIKNFNLHNDTIVELINESGNKVSRFEYDCLDGVLCFGHPEKTFKKEYESTFDVTFDAGAQALFQSVMNIFFENKVMKKLTLGRVPLVVTQDFFQSFKSHFKKFYLNKNFAFLEKDYKSSTIEFRHQIFVDDDFKIKSRMKIEIDFRFSGNLVFYYDYGTKTLHLGKCDVVDEYAKPFRLYHPQESLFGLTKGDALTIENVKDLIDSFMEGVSHQLIIKAFMHHNIDGVSTDDITLENKDDYWNLLEMKTI
jgi:hypothetical protein